MLKIDRKDIYHDNYGWLDTYHHFSFADYYDPDNMNFGDIRVINDDIIKSGMGFETHPHRDMEIITYIIEGELTHGDSMENKRSIGEGFIQYMSAGTGVYHSEHNYGDKELRLLQIWITPDKKGYEPKYGDYEYGVEKRKNNFLHLVSGMKGDALIRINQDADIFVGEFDKDALYNIPKGKKIYGIVIEGKAKINGELLKTRDAFKIEEEDIQLKVNNRAHIIIFQTNK
ncbi:pirin family protein [Fusobacteria bacterium ZRK30]|nr:pirin family protein [Fusobacteria bacterium ZRK30]